MAQTQKESGGGTKEERTGANFAEGRAAADAKRAERYVRDKPRAAFLLINGIVYRDAKRVEKAAKEKAAADKEKKAAKKKKAGDDLPAELLAGNCSVIDPGWKAHRLTIFFLPVQSSSLLSSFFPLLRNVT
jgi:hypothetical protein